MSKSSKKTTVLTAGAADVLDLAQRLCSPYASALDQNHFAESGQEPPSVSFVPFQIFLGSLAQQCWRQLHDGTMKRADGTPIHNINTLIGNKEQELCDYVNQRYEGDFTMAEGDPRVLRLATQIEQMEAQRDMAQDFLDGFTAAYKHFFKKDWEPYVGNSNNAQATTRANAKAAIAAAAARLQAKGMIKAKEEAAA